jgi:hypothetical protein
MASLSTLRLYFKGPMATLNPDGIECSALANESAIALFVPGGIIDVEFVLE